MEYYGEHQDGELLKVDTINDQPTFAQQGWQCPICGRVYSPFTPMCYYCGGEQKIKTTIKVNWQGGN